MADLRKATIAATERVTLDRIARYLPSNYSARQDGEVIVIEGTDVAGWTMLGYVLPRLASGGYWAHEVVDASE
jgi:hypothetical protein